MTIGMGDEILGYREYAKDYKIEYEDVPGRKRPKAKRVYIGPWYRFSESPEKIRFYKWFYLIGMAVVAVLLLIPMLLDCSFTRAWYIQVPGVATWIPWVFAACATWRLWTAKEQVEREHRNLLCDRMSGSTMFMMGFCLISFLGCIVSSTVHTMKAADYVVSFCYMLSGICSIMLFARRKMVGMEKIEN